MRSTDPLQIEKIPFSERMEEPKQQEAKNPRDTVYEPFDAGNGYEPLYTDQIRELDEKIRAFGYQAPALPDQGKQSFFLFERGGITEMARRLRILAISGTVVYTVDDLEDIRESEDPIHVSITEAIMASEDPNRAALLLTDKDCGALREALDGIPEELTGLVRDREWKSAYDRWNACFFVSPPATWFYEDVEWKECCRILFMGALEEVARWMADEDGTAPDTLIIHIEFPHKKVGYIMSGTFNFEEQCIEMCSNTPLKGLTAKLIKEESSEMGFLIEDIYPDSGNIY